MQPGKGNTITNYNTIATPSEPHFLQDSPCINRSTWYDRLKYHLASNEQYFGHSIKIKIYRASTSIESPGGGVYRQRHGQSGIVPEGRVDANA